MTHEIELEGYYPKILGSPMRMLCLGTKASYGMEVLHFQRGTGWDSLALDVTFTPDPQAEGTTVLADAGDTVTLPLLVACAVAAGGMACSASAATSHTWC